jgi:hypothetical protein
MGERRHRKTRSETTHEYVVHSPASPYRFGLIPVHDGENRSGSHNVIHTSSGAAVLTVEPLNVNMIDPEMVQQLKKSTAGT